MKLFWARFGAVFWVLVVLGAVAALGFQAWSTHRQNVLLGERIRGLDSDIRRRENENLRLRRERAGLEKDPYVVERELRKGRAIGQDESVLPK